MKSMKMGHFMYQIIVFLNPILTFFNLRVLRPNLKNLSRGLNLSRGSNMVGFTYNCIKFFKI